MEKNYVGVKMKFRHSSYWLYHGERIDFNPRFIPLLIEKKKNKNLSAVCSALYLLEGYANDACEDIAAFGAPSECYQLVAKGIERDRERIIKESGFLHEEILAGVLRLRVNHKWLYNHGF